MPRRSPRVCCSGADARARAPVAVSRNNNNNDGGGGDLRTQGRARRSKAGAHLQPVGRRARVLLERLAHLAGELAQRLREGAQLLAQLLLVRLPPSRRHRVRAAAEEERWEGGARARAMRCAREGEEGDAAAAALLERGEADAAPAQQRRQRALHRAVLGQVHHAQLPRILRRHRRAARGLRRAVLLLLHHLLLRGCGGGGGGDVVNVGADVILAARAGAALGGGGGGGRCLAH
eukprot:scaffold3419_cov251-Prasinococcus_capsulatus_cf.AAC.4